MGRARRVSLALDEELLRTVDGLMVKQGEINRSRFINSLLANALAGIIEETTGGYVLSLVVLMYDHELGDVEKNVTDLQHEFKDLIRVTTHVHVGDRDCVEVIHAMGEYGKVQELVSRLSAIKKGIKFMRVINIPLKTQ
ncbi:CopG family ribbon-helix-helix protein [Caldivirga sp. MU80]|uniref:CopG family ribbon-helix-helix protein n=1 Tax=Caldivirga sp. MU80 TaxID=1650354 RepID=UPI0009FD3063|nr:CopG family ribbon-helix-helix protein [Caldivirga sp. MU80]